MTIAATQIWEVENGGSDTNGGGFNPNSAGMDTAGSVTSGTTSSPVFSSANYSFVAGDVGAWVFIKSGTNWIPGWYQIASVAGGAATLSAAIGQGVLWDGVKQFAATGMSTATGCVTGSYVSGTASATWTVDYSQQSSPIALTGMTSSGANAIILTSSATKAMVGNTINMTGGTNFTTGWYSIIAATAGVSITVDRNDTVGVGATGTGNLGGAFASPGTAAANTTIQGQIVMVKYNASVYSITSASTNISSGSISGTNYTIYCGYNTSRFVGNSDANRPTLQIAASTSGVTIFTGGVTYSIWNFILDGNSNTTSKGINTRGLMVNCKGINLTAGAFLDNGATALAHAVLCEATSCATVTPFSINALSCVSHANTTTGFTSGWFLSKCLSYGNTGASSDGFAISNSGSFYDRCVAYNNGRDGFHNNNGNQAPTLLNCIAEANAAVGFNLVGSNVPASLINCASYNNTTSRYGSGSSSNPVFDLNPITQSAGSFFANAASSNFALNSTAGQGALCRGLGYPSLSADGLSNDYADVGAFQHQDSAAPGIINVARIFQNIGTY